MTELTQGKIFEDKDLELLPAYLLLAEANICKGGNNLGNAEAFLIAANWNLLKHEPSDQKEGEHHTFVTPQEMKTLDGNLHKTFGRLFLQQMKDLMSTNSGDFDSLDRKALDELSKGIYYECVEHGPESYRMCTSYFYMGELFKLRAMVTKEMEEKKEYERKMTQHRNAKSFFAKIIEIWKDFILQNDFDQD